MASDVAWATRDAAGRRAVGAGALLANKAILAVTIAVAVARTSRTWGLGGTMAGAIVEERHRDRADAVVVAVDVTGAAIRAPHRGQVATAPLCASKSIRALTIVIAVAGAKRTGGGKGAMAAASVDEGESNRLDAIVVAVDVTCAAGGATGRGWVARAADRRRKAAS